MLIGPGNGGPKGRERMPQEYYNYQRQQQQHQLDSNPRYREPPPDHANQPPYNYRDQSLYPTPQMASAIQTRRQRFRTLRTFIQIGFVLLPLAGAWILANHYAATYNTYKRGICTINSKDVKEVDSHDKHGRITNRTYYPRLYYDVHTVKETQVSATGYDGPTAQGYSSYEEAQTIVARYQIGQQVPCWYNPATPEKAFIVFYGFTSADWTLTAFWGICGFGAFMLITYLLFDWMIWRLLALHKRGVVTQGRVTKTKQTRDRSGKIHYTSIVNFQALEEHGRERTIQVAGYQKVNTLLPVCYDPLFPRYRRNGEWPGYSGPVVGMMLITLLTISGLIILYLIWLTP